MRTIKVMLLLALTACSTTVGPVVTSVRTGKDGAIVVERCDITIRQGLLGSSDAVLENCHTGRSTEQVAAHE